MIAPPPAGRALGRRWELREVTAELPGRIEYRGFDRDAGTEVSVWWLRPELWPDTVHAKRAAGAASATRQVAHPAVRRLHAVAWEGPHLLAAWQVAGSGPRPRSDGPLALDALCRWCDAVAAGLGALHLAGAVHGRLVPEDIVDVGGALCVGGAGLWAEVDASAAARAWWGRERFLAPEVRAGIGAGAAADVYSVAAIAAELIAGPAQSLAEAMERVARRHPGLHAVLSAHTAERPEHRRGDLPQLAAEVRRCAVSPYLIDPGERAAPAAPSRPAAVRVASPLQHPRASTPTPRFAGAPVPTTPHGSPRRATSSSPVPPSPPPAAAPAPEPPSEPGQLATGTGAPFRIISMKPAATRSRPPTMPPRAAPKAQLRAMSEAMARTYSTAPGSLGYLAPPRRPSEAAPRSRLRFALTCVTVTALLAGAAIAGYLVALRL